MQGHPRVSAGARKNRLAIAALTCGIGEFLFWRLGRAEILPAALALVFGLISITQIKRGGEAGRGMAVTGVVLGGLGIAVWVIVLIIIISATPTSKYN